MYFISICMKSQLSCILEQKKNPQQNVWEYKPNKQQH